MVTVVVAANPVPAALMACTVRWSVARHITPPIRLVACGRVPHCGLGSIGSNTSQCWRDSYRPTRLLPRQRRRGRGVDRTAVRGDLRLAEPTGRAWRHANSSGPGLGGADGLHQCAGISLFALIPAQKIGVAALVVAVLGLTFVAGSLLSLLRVRGLRWRDLRDLVFLAGLIATFATQLAVAVAVIRDPADAGAIRTIAVLVVVCFLIGVARSWELIGGRSIGLGHELGALVRKESTGQATDVAGGRAPDEPAGTV